LSQLDLKDKFNPMDIQKENFGHFRKWSTNPS